MIIKLVDYQIILILKKINSRIKLIPVDLSKQQTLDVDPKAIQQINFNGDLERYGNENTTMFFIIEEANKAVSYFLPGALKVR